MGPQHSSRMPLSGTGKIHYLFQSSTNPALVAKHRPFHLYPFSQALLVTMGCSVLSTVWVNAHSRTKPSDHNCQTTQPESLFPFHSILSSYVTTIAYDHQMIENRIPTNKQFNKQIESSWVKSSFQPTSGVLPNILKLVMRNLDSTAYTDRSFQRTLETPSLCIRAPNCTSDRHKSIW